MIWVFLVLASLLVTGGNNILDKYLMKGQKAHPLACVASFSVIGVPLALITILSLPPIPPHVVALAVGAGVLFISAVWLYYNALRSVDISRVVPLLRLTAIQTLLLGVLWLGETLTAWQQVAFGVMVLSGLFLSIKPTQGSWITLDKDLFLILPITSLLALDNIMMASVYHTVSIWHGIAWHYVGVGIGLVLWLIRQRPQLVAAWPLASGRIWGILAVEQLGRLGTTVAEASAIAHGIPVALVSALHGAQLMWVWLLAALLLHETTPREERVLKGVGIIGMAVGVIFLTR